MNLTWNGPAYSEMSMFIYTVFNNIGFLFTIVSVVLLIISIIKLIKAKNKNNNLKYKAFKLLILSLCMLFIFLVIFPRIGNILKDYEYNKHYLCSEEFTLKLLTFDILAYLLLLLMAIVIYFFAIKRINRKLFELPANKFKISRTKIIGIIIVIILVSVIIFKGIPSLNEWNECLHYFTQV